MTLIARFNHLNRTGGFHDWNESGLGTFTLPKNQLIDRRSLMNLLGQLVRGMVGGRMMTILLTDYDVSSDSYDGVAITLKQLDSNSSTLTEQIGQLLHGDVLIRPARGYRQFPYTTRPDYVKQFVLVGEDEQPLIDLAQADVDKNHPNAVAQANADASVALKEQHEQEIINQPHKKHSK
jgi:hypothetical protein